jgi:hypothetical protein
MFSLNPRDVLMYYHTVSSSIGISLRLGYPTTREMYPSAQGKYRNIPRCTIPTI